MSVEQPVATKSDMESIYLEDKSLNYTSTSLTQPVRLRIGESGLAAKAPLTVSQVFQATAEKHASGLAIVDIANNKWTWSQYYAEAKKAAKSFMKVGLEAHEVVNIIGFNSPEWFLSDVGAILAGGVAAGVYTSNEPEACFYQANHSECAVVVCEGYAQLAKYLSIADRLPKLKAIVVYNIGEKETVKTDTTQKVPIYTWTDFMKLADAIDNEDLEKRMKNQKPGDACTLIYTSGTTGPPKAVMCSHDNLTWTAASTIETIGISANDTMVSFLPLSHIAAQMLDIISPLSCGYTVYFADSSALKGTIVETLKKAQPTIFFAVPRVWEKIQEKMVAIGRNTKGAKLKVATWAKSKGLENAKAMEFGSKRARPGCFGCANSLVYSKVKANLGLARLRLAASGASPISKETIGYFASLNIHIYELYGMSECTGPASINTPLFWKMGTVGKPIPGTTIKIVPETSEIIYTGRHILMGYLKMEEQTNSTIDADGYLHSGDQASLDEDGFFRITGRIKELIKTSGGENIPPVLIENALKKNMPFISNVVVIGDNKKFLACLITLQVKVNPDSGEASTELVGESLVACKAIGSTAVTSEQAMVDPKWTELINKGVAAANKEAISKAQYINKWKVLPHDFTLPGGELTATLKLKRNVVYRKYENVIEEVYAEAEGKGKE